MKLRKISLVLLLISSVSLAEVTRRPMPRQRGEHQLRPQKKIIQNNTVELDLSYDFFVPGETFKISFIVVLPQTQLNSSNLPHPSERLPDVRKNSKTPLQI